MKRIFTIIAASAAIFSCTKVQPSDPVDPVKPVPEEIIIGVGSDDQKTVLSGTSVLWEDTDTLMVFSNTNSDGVKFRLKEGEGTTSARFTNRLYDDVDPVEITGETFYLCYPAGIFSKSSSIITAKLSPNVDYVPGSFGTDVNPSFAVGTDLSAGSFTMQNLCGLVKLALKGSSKITKIDLTLDKDIAGTAVFSVSDVNPALAVVADGSKTIAMHCNNVQLNASTATDFYFVVPAGTYNSLKLTVYNDKGAPAVMSKTLTIAVERSSVSGLASTLPADGIAGTIDLLTEIPWQDANDEKNREELTVASFNIRTQSNDSDVAVQKWSSRKTSVYKFFNDNQYGIIGTQECEYRQKAEILANVSGYTAFGRGSEYGKDESGSSGYGLLKKDYEKDSANYIFYRSSQYQILESGIFWLSATPDKISKYSASNHYRACDWARFKSLAEGNQEFYVFNTHLDNSTDAVRGQQLDVLWNRITEINTDNLPMVMMGDLNMTTTGSPLATFKSSGKMAFVRNELGVCFDDAHKSFNGFGTGGQSNIDHIAVKNFYKMKTFDTDINNYGVQYISDHYPIIATLMFQ